METPPVFMGDKLVAKMISHMFGPKNLSLNKQSCLPIYGEAALFHMNILFIIQLNALQQVSKRIIDWWFFFLLLLQIFLYLLLLPDVPKSSHI